MFGFHPRDACMLESRSGYPRTASNGEIGGTATIRRYRGGMSRRDLQSVFAIRCNSSFTSKAGNRNLPGSTPGKAYCWNITDWVSKHQQRRALTRMRHGLKDAKYLQVMASSARLRPISYCKTPAPALLLLYRPHPISCITNCLPHPTFNSFQTLRT